MLELPPAPSPERPRTLFLATALVCGAGTMLFGGMLAIYLGLRYQAGNTTANWLPRGVEVPDVSVHIMMITMVGACVMAQWAVSAIRQGNRRDTALALGVLALFGVAVLNAQVYVYNTMELDIRANGYSTLVFTITGAFLVALVAGIVFAVLMAFRELGGRYSAKDHDGISSLALYWYFLTLVFAGVWYCIYILE
jgi:heme/copper-type cytochrome/quinol oxidase subunit 3